MKPRFIDSHAHLFWDSYAEDRNEVIERAFEQGITQIVQAAVDIASIPEVIKLTEEYEHIFGAAGVHPHEAKTWQNDTANAIRSACKNPKIVAIGECGLDFHYNFSERESQLSAFAEQINLSKELKKPLIIHTRNAWAETFQILKEQKAEKSKAVFHCFTGTTAELPQILELDFYVSYSGIVTFSKSSELQETVAHVPDNRILIETDSPYLAPQGHRGKRNEPAYVILVAQKLAELRKTTVDEIAAITSANARRLFGLPEQ